MRCQIQAATTINPSVLEGPSISTAVSNDNRGNQFITNSRVLKELWKRYRSKAQYGNDLVKSIVDYRTGWISGNGASITAPRAKEKKWLSKFVEDTKLDSSFLTWAVKVGEIEGKCLILLKKEKSDDGFKIVLRTVLWDLYDYGILTDKDDTTKITGARFKDSDGKWQNLKPEEFVYVEIGRNGDINDPTPSIDGSTLTKIINLDKALSDWRGYNHIWGILGMMFESKDVAGAELMIKIMEEKEDWKLGDVLAGPARAYFPEPTGNGTKSIAEEITMNMRGISGNTGVGIHLLGFANDMSNRAVAEELTEGVYSKTAEPRDIWKDAVTEIAIKVIEMHNKLNGESLQTDGITTELAMVSRHQIKELIEVWLPLEAAGAIPMEYVQKRIPGVDVDEIKRLMDSEKEQNIERQKEMIGVMRGSKSDGDDPEDERKIRAIQ